MTITRVKDGNTGGSGGTYLRYVDNLDTSVLPTVPDTPPSSPNEGDIIIQYHSNEYSTNIRAVIRWEYNGTAWEQIGEIEYNNIHITEEIAGLLDRENPPSEPVNHSVNEATTYLPYDTLREEYDNGYVEWFCDGTFWLFKYMRLYEDFNYTVRLVDTNPGAANTALIHAAIANGVKNLTFPPGEYEIEDIQLNTDGLRFVGAGMPFPNDARTQLVGGTVLKGGAIDINYRDNISITDIGFDSTISGTYAVFSGDSGVGQQNVLLQNVCALGRNFATSHAFYFTAGNNIICDNCRAYKFDHALALRTSHAQVTNFYAEDCLSSSIVLKGIHDYDSKYITVNGVTVLGNTIPTAPIVIEGHDGMVSSGHTLSNIVMKNVTRGIIFKSADNNTGDGFGRVTNVILSNISIETVQYEAILFQYRNISNILLDNVIANDTSLAYAGQAAFDNQTDATTIRLYNTWTNNTVPTKGYFQVKEVNGDNYNDVMGLRDLKDSVSSSIFAIKNGLNNVFRQSDSFISNVSAGALHNTDSQPGPGKRLVADSGNHLSISGGSLVWTAGVGTYDPAIIFNKEIVRVPGKILKINFSLSSGRIGVGFVNSILTSAIGDNRRHAIDINPGNIKTISNGASSVPATVTTANAVDGIIHIILRRKGAFYLLKGFSSTFTHNELVKIDESQLNEILYACIYSVGTSMNSNVKEISTLDTLWCPSPIVSDGFSINGTTDGLGHLEGIEDTVGKGGSGLSWVDEVGTIASVSGRAKATTLLGGNSISTLNISTNRVLVRCRLYGTGAEFGIILRYTDTNNYLFLYHDGTNLLLKQLLAGVETTLRTTAATYVQGAFIEASFTGNLSCNLYYNDEYAGFTTAINAALTSTKFGIFFKNTTNEIDDFQIYARGSSNEYSEMETL